MKIELNKSNKLNELKKHDFSVTKFKKDLKTEKTKMLDFCLKRDFCGWKNLSKTKLQKIWRKKIELLVVKSRENYELKTDRLAHKTGNIYVEFESRNKKSGILVSKADIWIFRIVNKSDKHLFSIEIPLDRLKKMVNKGYKIAKGGDNLTSQGYLIPINDLIKIW